MVQRPIPTIQTVCRTTEFPQLLHKVIDVPVVQVEQVVHISVVKHGRLPMVFRTTETPQFLVGKVADVPVVQVEQVPLVPSGRRQPSSVCPPLHAA